MRSLITSSIVLGILALVGGLGLCFVGNVRGAAARMHCMNNLKQLALSVDNYHDGQGHYPRATVPHDTLPPDRRLSWMPDILPYTECMGGRVVLDPEKAWDEEPNRVPMFQPSDKDRTDDSAEVARAYPYGSHRLFLCPANPTREGAGLPAFTHYVGIAGVGGNAATLPLAEPKVGFFGHDRVVRRSDVTDGLSNTILLIETATENGPWTAGGYPTVRGLDPHYPRHVGRGAPFSSRHLNSVVNFAMGDGSVKPITPRVEPAVLEALITIHGGEVWGCQ